jgi:hypothetical protein
MSSTEERRREARQDAWRAQLGRCPKCRHDYYEVKLYRNAVPPYFEARCWCLADNEDGCACDWQTDGPA